MSYPTRATRETRIVAACQLGDYCRWTYNGPRSYIEADRHASVTGHDVVVVETIRTAIASQASRELAS